MYHVWYPTCIRPG